MIEVAQSHLLTAFAVFLVIQTFGLVKGLRSGSGGSVLFVHFVFTLLGAGIGYATLVLLPQVI
jgi:hypothetical protein